MREKKTVACSDIHRQKRKENWDLTVLFDRTEFSHFSTAVFFVSVSSRVLTEIRGKSW